MSSTRLELTTHDYSLTQPQYNNKWHSAIADKSRDALRNMQWRR